jgi:hypothetical protein
VPSAGQCRAQREQNYAIAFLMKRFYGFARRIWPQTGISRQQSERVDACDQSFFSYQCRVVLAPVEAEIRHDNLPFEFGYQNSQSLAHHHLRSLSDRFEQLPSRHHHYQGREGPRRR